MIAHAKQKGIGTNERATDFTRNTEGYRDPMKVSQMGHRTPRELTIGDIAFTGNEVSVHNVNDIYRDDIKIS